ncbi:RNA recognition motif domain-containing protein [Thalassotalea maritima]|uniref:RNA recognition motif domain-containing protein n=1 Tax=Thalassotalea maritima TaxID=3242416 RepID=UPI003528C32C
MNSRLVLTWALVAIALTIIGYYAASATGQLDQASLALGLFVGALLAPCVVNFIYRRNDYEVEETNLKTLYVGNLPYRANEATVRSLFAEYGSVHSVRLMKDKHTGKRRGFGFVEIAANDIDNIIEALNDTEFQQRTLKVREAKERPNTDQSRA